MTIRMCPMCNADTTGAWCCGLDLTAAEVEALRKERRIPAVFDPDTGRALVVEKHDWCEGTHFRNVWIVPVTPNAKVTGAEGVRVD
jgi:hypothetical protein